MTQFPQEILHPRLPNGISFRHPAMWQVFRRFQTRKNPEMVVTIICQLIYSNF
jgi:hypothetical protein